MKNLKVKFFTILIFYQCLLFAQNEAYYVDILALRLNGAKEYKVENGRVDIVTETHAIEVEWATNWKHSIGQAIWYGLQTNKKPGIILVMKDVNERKYGIMLQSALNYAGISDMIKVWFYPEDFGGDFQEMLVASQAYKNKLLSTGYNYSRNKNSGVRHKSTCTYFDCANCVPCGPNDGKKACGKCGG